MSPSVSIFLLLVIFAEVSIFDNFCLSSANLPESSVMDITIRACTNKTAPPTDVDSFNANFQLAISVVLERAKFLGHGFDVEGDPNNSSNPVVYAYADCYKGIDLDNCSTCLATASTNVYSCPYGTANGTRGGLSFRGPCFLRYDDHDFRTKTLSSTVPDKSLISRCGNVTASSGFRDMADEFLKKMSLEAPKNAGVYYVATTVENQAAFYGLARCFEYVSGTECERCLSSAASRGKDCLSKTLGGVVNYGCFAQYSPFDIISLT